MGFSGSPNPAKVRVLCIFRDFGRGGAEYGALDFLSRLDRSRFQATVFCLRDEGPLRARLPADVPVVSASADGRSPHLREAPRLLARLARLARDNDVLFGTKEGAPILLAALGGLFAGRPSVGWVQTHWSRVAACCSVWHRLALRLLYPRVSRMVCVSEGVARDLTAASTLSAGRVVIIPSPVFLDEVRLAAEGPLPDWAGSAFTVPTVVSVGRLDLFQKALDVLLRSFALLLERGLDAHLLLLGDGPSRGRLETLARELGISEKVLFPGHQANPFPLVKRSSLFALSSNFEGLPRVLVEALALGVPVVSTDCPSGPRELLQDGRCGLLVPPGDAGALAEAMERLLRHPEEAAHYARRGLERSAEYDGDRVCGQLAQVLSDAARPDERGFEPQAPRPRTRVSPRPAGTNPSTVVLVHNYYQQAGGEEVAFHGEAALLESHGLRVVRFTRDNETIGARGVLRTATDAIWSQEVYRDLRALLARERPRVVHCHNTFPLVSPAAFRAAHDEGVPVVVTVQNYRLFCARATLARDGRVCEDCLARKLAWPAVVHACYRGSRAATAAVVLMQASHRLMGAWTRHVDAFITPTSFLKGKLGEGGLESESIFVKPNFLEIDPGAGPHDGGFALFVGRLSEEKGLRTLLSAWQLLDNPLPLSIAGSGPQLEPLQAVSAPAVRWLGRQAPDAVLELMRRATFLVIPSEWYEGLPFTLLEATGAALPILASRLGGLAEAVQDGETGLLFAPAEPRDLAAKVRWALEHPGELARMGMEARRRGLELFGPKANYTALMNVYAAAEERFRSRRDVCTSR